MAQPYTHEDTQNANETQPDTLTQLQPRETPESSPVETPAYLTVSDVMALLRVSQDTVYRLLHRGEIRFVKTGAKSIRVHPEALEEWRRRQEA